MRHNSAEHNDHFRFEDEDQKISSKRSELEISQTNDSGSILKEEVKKVEKSNSQPAVQEV